MIIRIITVQVRSDSIDAFKAATVENHAGSIAEPGVLRFDVLQDAADPAAFVLYEVYSSEDATARHKETDHYRRWKDRVEPMMASPRQSRTFKVVAPAPEYR